MPSYLEDPYYDSYHDTYYQVPYPPSTSSFSDKPLIKKKKAKTLSKAPVRTKPGPDPSVAIRKLENGVRKVCRKVSEAAIEVCTKIYNKSRSVVSTAAEKSRSIKFKRPTSEARHHLKISNPSSPTTYYF